MRILFISAFYPPYVVGGWEQLVRDINNRLKNRGHQTMVLTSNYGVPASSLQQMGIERTLHLESDIVNYSPMDFIFRYRRRLEDNLRTTRQAIESFRPDVVFIHVMWNLTRGVPYTAEQMLPGRVVYYVANEWPYASGAHRAYWEDPARPGPRRWLKKLFAPLALRRVEQMEADYPLRFEHVMCVSQDVQSKLAEHARIPEENLEVVYNGVEIDRFAPVSTGPEGGYDRVESGLSLLYAGSLVPHKGVHTAVEAMDLLRHQGELEGIALTIVGSGNPHYEERLHKLVKEKGLEEHVHFWSRVSREKMPALLRKFDVLVFPSLWDEPLARMMQEAMATGLVVVGTPTGGTPEILKDGETGLCFPAGDAGRLAAQLRRLSHDPDLGARLSRKARSLVKEKFSFERMIDEIEDYFQDLVAERMQENQHQAQAAPPD